LTIRLGQVEYINVLPVFYPLTAGWVEAPVELVTGTPAQLNRALRTGNIDVGVVSAFEYAQNRSELVLLPDLSIAAEKEVGSVLLFGKERFDTLDGKKFALTSSSATSAALTKILCRWYFNIKPEFEVMAPDLDKMLEEAPACLLIGDDALRARQRAEGLFVQDCATAWFVLTGLPMVFAVWAARKESVRKKPQEFIELTKALYRARQLGRENIETVIDAAKQRVGLSVDDLRHYYTLQKYELGAEYQRGLLSFYDFCARLRLVPRVASLEFVELPA
jgi:chorismate dehydratase